MPPKQNKKSKQINIERLLLYPIPEIERPQAFFTIKEPQVFQFPLESTLLEGIQLLEQYNPKDINKNIQQGYPIQRITKYKGKLCIQFKNKGFLFGNTYMNIQSISCFTCEANYLIIAFENRSLKIFGLDLKQIKQIKNFTDKKITSIKIINTPTNFQGILLLTTTGFDVTVHRLEKSFFTTFSHKLCYEAMEKSKTPIVQFNQLPRIYKNYLNKDLSYAQSTLISIISINEIWILKLNLAKILSDKFTDVIYHRSHTDQRSTSYAMWNQAELRSMQYQISGINLILNYCFGNKYYMATFRPISNYASEESTIRYEWIQSNPFTMGENKQIIYCNHIKNKQILLILKPNQIMVYHTSGIQLFDNQYKQGDRQCISYNYQNKLQTRKVAPELQYETYTDSFFSDLNSNQIYCVHKYNDDGIEKLGIGIYVYCNWKQICDMLKVNDNYTSAMNFIIAIFKRANKFELGMRHSEKDFRELSEYIQDLSVEYVKQKFLKIKDETEEVILAELSGKFSQFIDLLLTPFEFLINTCEFKFLFQKFKHILCSSYITENIFYKILEPFIQHGRIKYIPDQELIYILNYYVNNDKLELIERMAISFDLQKIQRGIIIQCCLNNNLTVSLAYICTQGNQSEFVTPFIKFWGMGLSFKNKGMYDYAQLFAIRALWYVKLCLQRNMSLKDISQNKYGDLMKILTQKIFTKSMIQSLLQIRVESCLDTLSFYFSLENMSIVNQFIIIKYSQEIRILDWINSVNGNQNLELMLSAIYYYLEQVKSNRTEQDEKIQDEQFFYLFLSKIIIFKTIKFQKEKYLEILRYFILNYPICKKINYGVQKIPEDKLSEEQIDEIYASQYINKLLILIKFQIRLQSYELNQIYQTSRLVPLTQLQAQISFLENNYKNCIDIYLRGRQFSKKRIFRFIENNLKNLILEKRDKEKKKFQKEIKARMRELITLDPAESQKIIQAYLPQSQEELINALSYDQTLQLEYLNNVIHSNYRISESYVLKYVELMCKYQPNNLIQAFKSHAEFPVEQCIKICQQYKVYDCMEYLYERMGQIQKSVQIASLRIQEIFLQKYNEQLDQNDIDPYIKIATILSNVIEICKNNHSEAVWESLFDSSVKLFKRFKQDKKFEEEIDIFYEINAKILYNLMSYCNLDHSIWLIKQKYSDLDMGGSMKKAFMQILSNYSYKQNIFYTARELNKLNLTEFNQIHNKKFIRAFSLFNFCASCHENLKKKDKLVSFYCGHTYHKDCMLQLTQQQSVSYCIECLKQQNNQFNVYLHSNDPHNPKLKIHKIIDESEKLKQMMIQNIKNQEKNYLEKIIEQREISKINSKLDKLKNYDKSKKQIDEAKYKLDRQYEEKQKKLERISQKLPEVFEKVKTKRIYGYRQ